VVSAGNVFLFSMPRLAENIAFGCGLGHAGRCAGRGGPRPGGGLSPNWPQASTRWWGSGAIRLSGASASAISLARAILRNPELLILSMKATSALDSQSERPGAAGDRAFERQRTVLVIAHTAGARL